MKAFLVILLAAVLCTESGGSLQCYTCQTALSNNNCQTATECPNASQVCKTDVIKIMGVSIISKECAASCQPSYQDFAVGNRNVSCCASDFCNSNGAAGAGSGYGAMALGLAASLLGARLANGL